MSPYPLPSLVFSSVNDAGKELLDHPGRVDAFLDFLGAGKDDPRRGGARLYSSHEFGEAPRKARIGAHARIACLAGGKTEAVDVLEDMKA